MTHKKVLVADRIAKEGIDVLRDKGYDVDVKLDLTEDELAAQIAPYDAIVVRSATPVTRRVIEAAENLKIIGRAGVGVDTIDLDAATERGVIVCNAPTSNIMSAAEHTMALMLACARQLPQANASMHEGKWERSKFLGKELYEKTLAIFGLGRIGGLVAERARAFGMKIIGHDPYCSPERADQLGVELFERVEDVLARADFITVHLPKTPETIGMFGPEEFAAMKDGVVLINAARGGIYNVKSLSDFVAAGKIFAAGIDMFEEEPCTGSPLHEFDNVLLTPHLGASTHEAQVRAGVQIAEYVSSGLEGSIVPTALNMTLVPPEMMDAVGPYVPACQMMGRILAQILGCIPKTLRVEAAGTIANADASILVAGALDGILAYRRAGSVTPVNVESVAVRHGHQGGHRLDRRRRRVRVGREGRRRRGRSRCDALRLDAAPAHHVAARLQDRYRARQAIACVRVRRRPRSHRRDRHVARQRGCEHHDDADRHEALREDGARVHERRGQRERPTAREALEHA